MPFLQAQSDNMLVTAVPLYGGVEPSKHAHACVEPLNRTLKTPSSSIAQVDLAYDHTNSDVTARELVYRLRPKWRDSPHEIEITKFTDGITNTLLRIARRQPRTTQEEVDRESILMRAYGNNTDLIIDRDREAHSHALLAERGMAPPLLARFENGLLYKYIPGKPCTPDDFTTEPVWRGVAKKLAEWHARVPISTVSHDHTQSQNGANGLTNGHSNGTADTCDARARRRSSVQDRFPEPNLWTVLEKWVLILPQGTEKERAKRELLQHEIQRTFEDLDTQDGIGERGLVFGHLDLLSGNVIKLPYKPDATTSASAAIPVTFIDYEYATPCPAAFDIANHFAEWAGFDLDYNRLPTRQVRRAFLTEYVNSYNQFASVKVDESMISSLEEQTDRWRGIPGLFWGIWGLIQAMISQIDFDYASYAEDRLNEYWAWRAETNGTRAATGKAAPLREVRWAQD